MTEKPRETEQPQHVGVFRKLVRGQYGLANTYWRFGVFGGIAFGILHGLASAQDSSGIAGLSVLLVHFAYQIAVSVGVWRAASAYQGLAIWHILARGAVVLGLVASSVLLSLRVMDVLDEIGVSEWGKANGGPATAVVCGVVHGYEPEACATSWLFDRCPLVDP